MTPSENSPGVPVHRMQEYGHRRFGDSRIFERDEVRLVGTVYRAVLCTFRQKQDEDPQVIFEYRLPREYRTVGEAVNELLRQRVDYLRTQAEEHARAVRCARAETIDSGTV